MSPQPSRIKLASEDLDVVNDVIFGESTGSSLTVPKTLIDQVWAQVNEGTRMLTRGGLEVGGLLVGPKGGGNHVVVDRIVPISIEYRYGPVFQMSPSDLAGIVLAVESVQNEPSKVAVGFYRSRTRGE